MPRLIRVMPNERWQLVLQFADQGFYLFDAAIAREERGWPELAYPNKLKHLTFTEHAIAWPGGRTLDAAWLLARAQPIAGEELQRQTLTLGMRNQAPTAAHASHHVYGVSLCPFNRRPYVLEESIGGGHCERGGAIYYSLDELLQQPQWPAFFVQAGCGWAVPLIERIADETLLLDTLIKECCRRQDGA